MKEMSKRGGAYAPQRYDRENAATVKRRKPSKRKMYAARRRRAAGIALAACVALAVLLVGDSLFGAGQIHRGVQIGEVDVGGMTRDEARTAVERHTSAAFDEIQLGGGEFSVTGEQLGVKVDSTEAVAEAYSIGRQGWLGGRVFDVLRAYLAGVRMEPSVEYDEGAARTFVENLASEFNQKPKNATFHVTDSGKVEVQEASNGRVLDKEATLANLDRSLTMLSDEVPLAQGPPPKPEVSTHEVQSLRPTEVIGKYRTDFKWDSNPNRQDNMRLAAKAVNNTLLAPGEVFSFNELTSSLDYGEAKTFSDGGVAYADGGGLCQVSSTLYMAAQYANLEIVERHPHFAVLPYIKPGFDATVWFGDEGGWGVLDMKFKNNTDGYILIREWVDEDGFLNAEIHGRPTGTKVEMRTEKIFENPNRGIKWATYKKVTNKDGKVIFDGLIHDYIYGYNPPSPDGPHYETSAPRVAGWSDPTNTTGWANPH